MAWVFLVAAGLCEVIWAIGLKTYGFSRTWGGAMTVAVMLLSFVLLDRAMRLLPLGTSYAIWTGIGAIGTVIYGMIFLHESRDWPRVLCIVMVLAGIVGLKLLAPSES